MADIVFRCPECDKSLAVDERGAGRQINCPDCQKPITIPYPDTEPAISIQVDKSKATKTTLRSSKSLPPVVSWLFLAGFTAVVVGVMLWFSGSMSKATRLGSEPSRDSQTAPQQAPTTPSLESSDSYREGVEDANTIYRNWTGLPPGVDEGLFVGKADARMQPGGIQNVAAYEKGFRDEWKRLSR